MDGSSFVPDGLRHAGAVITTTNEVIWAEPMLARPSAQKAKIIALTKALELER